MKYQVIATFSLLIYLSLGCEISKLGHTGQSTTNGTTNPAIQLLDQKTIAIRQIKHALITNKHPQHAEDTDFVIRQLAANRNISKGVIELSQSHHVQATREHIIKALTELRYMTLEGDSAELGKLYEYNHYSDQDLDKFLDQLNAYTRLPNYFYRKDFPPILAEAEYKNYQEVVLQALKRPQHQVPVREQLNFEDVKELHRQGKLAFHVTPKSNVASIKKTGLDPNYSGFGGCSDLKFSEIMKISDERERSKMLARYQRFQFNSIGFIYFSRSTEATLKPTFRSPNRVNPKN